MDKWLGLLEIKNYAVAKYPVLVYSLLFAKFAHVYSVGSSRYSVAAGVFII